MEEKSYLQKFFNSLKEAYKGMTEGETFVIGGKTGPGFDSPMLQPGAPGVPKDGVPYKKESAIQQLLGPQPPVNQPQKPEQKPIARLQESKDVLNKRPASVLSAIGQASKEFNVPSDLLIDIAYSESNLDPENSAKKGGLDSSAAGLFMFIDSSWKQTMKQLGLPEDTPKTDPYANARAAAYQIARGNLGWWDESKNKGRKWGTQYNDEELANFDIRLQ